MKALMIYFLSSVLCPVNSVECSVSRQIPDKGLLTPDCPLAGFPDGNKHDI